MEEIKNLFIKYKPIESIYETENEYIAIPKTKGEPLVVYYDKKLKQFTEVYFYQSNNITDDLENANLIYGKEFDFND